MSEFLPCGAFGVGDTVMVTNPDRKHYQNYLCCIIEAKITLTLPKILSYGDKVKDLHWFDPMPEGVHVDDPKLRQSYGIEILGHGAVYWFNPKELQLVERGHLWNKLIEQRSTTHA